MIKVKFYLVGGGSVSLEMHENSVRDAIQAIAQGRSVNVVGQTTPQSYYIVASNVAMIEHTIGEI